MNRIVDCYTDGAYSSKTKCGGFACIVIENDELIGEFTGSAKETTNNRMEMEAFLAALKVANEIQTTNTEFNIFSDSAYITNCFYDQWYLRWQLNGWKASDKQPVKNRELWEEIIEQYKLACRHLKVNIYKVKGHNGNFWNEYVDQLAVKMRREEE